MKWPWVSREAYGEVCRGLEMTQALLLSANQERRELLDKYHALKVSGAAPSAVPVEKRPIDPVTAAINAVAGRSASLRGMMAHAAMEARREGASDDEIVRMIYDGVTPTEGLPA